MKKLPLLRSAHTLLATVVATLLALALAIASQLFMPSLDASAMPPGPPASGLWHAGAGLRSGELFVGAFVDSAGQQTYCTDVERYEPAAGGAYSTGHQGQFVRSDGSALSESENATVAYLLHRWGGTTDNETAAAVQLGVWALTSPQRAWDTPGMADILRRGNVPNAVAAQSKAMIETSKRYAGPYSVTVTLDAPGHSGTALVSVTSAAGAVTPGLSLSATATGSLTFNSEQGPAPSTSRTWTSTDAATALPLHKAAFGPGGVKVAVGAAPTAAVTWLEPSNPAAQRLLLGPVTAAPHAEQSVAAERPFHVEATTQTATPLGRPGVAITDHLVLAAGADSLWLKDPATGSLVPVAVTSTLWGPIPAPPAETATIPEGTPKVGSVSLLAEGPGTYTSPSIKLPAAGYYVWTTATGPASTGSPAAQAMITPWNSTFGAAAETTVLPWQPEVSTALSATTGTVGDTVRDAVSLAGLPTNLVQGSVTLTMYGPLTDPPAQQASVPEGSHVVATVEVPFTAKDGSATAQSPTFPALTQPGCYTVVASLSESPAHSAFASAFGVPAETVCISAPVVPQSNSVQAVAVLANTGANSVVILGIAAGLLGTGLALGIVSWRRRQS